MGLCLDAAHLDVVVLTLIGGLQAEVGEVELDAVAMRRGYVPHHELVVGVWLREFRGGEAAI